MEIWLPFNDAFTSSLTKRVLKRRFLEIGRTKIFKVRNFGNTLGVFFIKIFKI